MRWNAGQLKELGWKAVSVGRVTNRLKRELMRVPPIQFLRDRAYEQQLAQHLGHLPKLTAPQLLNVLETVRSEGVCEAPVRSLNLPLSDSMLASLDVLVAELKALPPVNGQNAPRLPLSRVYEAPDVFSWGLQEPLLDLVENYIGLPVHYHGADLRREIADGRPTDVRQWHVDAEDRRMFKVIVYLNDVTEEGGPFRYTSRPLTRAACSTLGYLSGFVPDADMEKVVARHHWSAATGPKGTAVFADTAAVFHRAQAPLTTDRYSVTFSYMSRQPMKTYYNAPPSAAQAERLKAGLSARQRDCLAPFADV
jgi:hypothetical protein